MVAADSRGNVFATVLAAGSASRFGRTKQLEVVGGLPLVSRAMKVARQVCGTRTILVTGHDRVAVMNATGKDLSYMVVNEQHDDGIGRSIAAAARAIDHVADAMLILLADQPLVTAAHLESLLENWSGKDDEIVATSFTGTLGPPVLFPRAAFADLGKLSGDIGARDLLRSKQFDVKSVEFADAAVDIDTEDDLARV